MKLLCAAMLVSAFSAMGCAAREPLHVEHAPVVVATTPAADVVPEVSGSWKSEDWGDVVVWADGVGSYSKTYGTGLGKIELQRITANMYTGSWAESEARSGLLVVTVDEDGRTARGIWAPDPRSTVGSLEGGVLVWTR